MMQSTERREHPTEGLVIKARRTCHPTLEVEEAVKNERAMAAEYDSVPFHIFK